MQGANFNMVANQQVAVGGSQRQGSRMENEAVLWVTQTTSREEFREQPRREVTCYRCGFEGHVAQSCTRPRVRCRDCREFGHRYMGDVRCLKNREGKIEGKGCIPASNREGMGRKQAVGGPGGPMGDRIRRRGGGNLGTRRPSPRENVACFGCGGQGHRKDVCPTVRNRAVVLMRDRGVVEAREEVRKEERKEDSSLVNFIIDSGADRNFHWNRKHVRNKRKANVYVETAKKGSDMVVNEAGDLELVTGGGYKLPKMEVLTTPDVGEPLLSVSEMAKSGGGYTIIFDKQGVKVYQSPGLEITGIKIVDEPMDEKGRYTIKLKVDDGEVSNGSSLRVAKSYSIGEQNKYLEAHRRNAHMSAEFIKRATGLPKMKVACPSCVKGKMVFHPHRSIPEERKTKWLPGEFLMSDMYGPFAPSWGGNRLSNCFMDKGSGFVWIEFLRFKSEHIESLKSVVTDCRARSGRKMRFYLRDKEGAHRSEGEDESKVEEYLRQRKIRGLFSAGGDHQKNATMERFIRTCEEGARTLMVDSGMPKEARCEAEECFVFTYNVVRVIPTEKKGVYTSRQNLLEGNNAEFKQEWLHTFGVRVHAMIPIGRRGPKTITKSRAFEGVMLGYSSRSQEYRIWDLEVKKVRLVSYNMCTFYENDYPCITKVTREVGDIFGIVMNEEEKEIEEMEEVKEKKVDEYEEAKKTVVWGGEEVWGRRENGKSK